MGENAWVDRFDHHLSNADIGPGYVAYENHNTGSDKADFWSLPGSTFRHADHWMTDVYAPGQAYGGHLLRPARPFRFQDGRLVVEWEVAAGVSEYGGNAWPEIIVTTAPAPTNSTVTDIHATHMFRGHWTFGCRLMSDRAIFCGLVSAAAGSDPAALGAKVWTVSQQEDSSGAASRFKVFSDPAFRVCAGTDPDTNCRDTFRLELEADRFALYVNGVRHMEYAGFPAGKGLPPELTQGDVYAYAVVLGLEAAQRGEPRPGGPLPLGPPGGQPAPPGRLTPAAHRDRRPHGGAHGDPRPSADSDDGTAGDPGPGKQRQRAGAGPPPEEVSR